MASTNRVLPVVLLALALTRTGAQEPAGAVPAGPGQSRSVPLPPGCDSGVHNLNVPAGHVLSFHTYALGVQIYRWNGTTWGFVGPRAMLFASSHFHGPVGIHYEGPTWESNGGSKVVAERAADCAPSPKAIAWLLLRVVWSRGPGPFERATYIQRVNTVGGLAPTERGMFIGHEMGVPYTAEYYFYRAHH